MGGKKLPTSQYSISWPKDQKSVGTKSVKVTLKGNYSGTKTLSYTVVPKGTSVSKVIGAKKAITATWKKQTTQITGYQLQYCLRKDFKSGAKTVTVANSKTTSKKITKLTAKKTYWVRVRTYRKAGGKTYFSTWSAVKSAKTS